MTAFVQSTALVPRVIKGEMAAIARLLSRADAAHPECQNALAEVYTRAGKAHIIGITGVPGSGKSTLVGVLARFLRNAGHKIGIIAIDPSSPYSGGSIMGDRIRMCELAGDEGIFIRSMATRGSMGGLARATLDSADILDVAGFGYILIETVGVGQDEVEIASASHTTVVVSAPGLGDEVQAIKAGVMEVADIHVVSKSDQPTARSTATDIKQMLLLGLGAISTNSWQPPVILTSCITASGFDQLVTALDDHKTYIETSEAGAVRRRRIATFRILKMAEELMRNRFRASSADRVAALADRLADRKISPFAAGEQLLNGIVKGD